MKIAKVEQLVRWWDVALSAFVAALTFGLILCFSGCTSEQIATAKGDVGATATRFQALAIAYQSNEATIDQVELEGAALAKKVDPQTAADLQIAVAAERSARGSIGQAIAIAGVIASVAK